MPPPPNDPGFRGIFLEKPEVVPAPTIHPNITFFGENTWIASTVGHMAKPLSVDATEVWGGVDGSWST